MNILPPEKIEQLKDAFQRGLSTRAAALECDVNRETAGIYFREWRAMNDDINEKSSPKTYEQPQLSGPEIDALRLVAHVEYGTPSPGVSEFNARPRKMLIEKGLIETVEVNEYCTTWCLTAAGCALLGIERMRT